jgi:hypothetical protein
MIGKETQYNSKIKLTDQEILEQNYIIIKDGINYFGYSKNDSKTRLCNASTESMVKYHLLNQYMMHKYPDAEQVKKQMMEVDTNDSMFVELVDIIFKKIDNTAKSDTLEYGLKFPLYKYNFNDVLKAINYLNYKGYKTFIDNSVLLISWA